jgi:hypothetical protein
LNTFSKCIDLLLKTIKIKPAFCFWTLELLQKATILSHSNRQQVETACHARPLSLCPTSPLLLPTIRILATYNKSPLPASKNLRTKNPFCFALLCFHCIYADGMIAPSVQRCSYNHPLPALAAQASPHRSPSLLQHHKGSHTRFCLQASLHRNSLIFAAKQGFPHKSLCKSISA